jgi:hypothetical protein
MARAHKVNVLRVDLKLSGLGIGERLTLASLVATVAPQSSVYGANPAVQSAVDKAIQSGVALEETVTDMRNMEMKLAAAKATVAATQAQFDKDMLCLKSVVEANCKTEVELNGVGFNRRAPKAAPGALVAPVSIVFKPGKEKGSMVATARRVGRVSTYAAEISANPVGPDTWQPIPGVGARRTLTGYVSGGTYWLRFRSVRATAESAWSDPVAAVAR